MSFRRRLLALAAAVLAAAAAGAGLSACRAPERARPGTIQFWTLDLAPKFNGTIQGVISEWERRNPGYDVVWTDVP